MLKERLTILLENNVITQDVFDYVLEVHEEIISVEKIDGSPMEVFLTHLAMATQRIVNQDIVNGMEEAILDDVKSSDYFEDAKRISDLIVQKSFITIPESEQHYFWLHLSSALQERGQPND